MEEAAKLINEAKKPFVIFGQGVILGKAEKEFKAFIEKGGLPAAWTLLGLSALPTDHPQNVEMLGMHGNYGANIKTNECDVLIAIGMRFDDRITGDVQQYAKQAKIIHIDIDESEINKIIPVDVAVHADAREAINMMIGLIDKNTHDDWLNGFKVCDRLEFEKVTSREINPTEGKIKMAEVIDMISTRTAGNAIIVSDVGQHQMVTSRYFKYQQPNTNITSGGLGTMGFALPAAIGAKLGKPDMQVIAIIGDGGFQMTLQELGTIFQSKVPVKIIILNNQFLGMVRQWQQLFFEKRYSFTEMINPDFTAIAKGFYIEATKLESRENLSAAIDTLLNHKDAYLLEIIVEKEENVFPMIPTGASISKIRLE